MAYSDFSYSGHTGALYAACYVEELSSSGSTRRVRVRIAVCSNDGFGERRDASYSVSCAQTGTNTFVDYYRDFWIIGDEQDIFNETFSVTASGGTAPVSLSFSVSMKSAAAGIRTISGGISELYLSAEPEKPEVTASRISLSDDTVQMGKKLLISLDRDDPGCRHQLRCYFGDGSFVEIGENIPGSHSWTVPDLTGRCPDALTLPCYIACITYYNGTYVGYTAAELTITVPDPTVPALEEENITLGSSCVVLCPRNSQHFTVKLTLEFYGLTLDIGEGKADSVRWDPGYEPAKQIPNLTYGTGTLKCTTYNGSAEVGTGTATVRVVVPENDVTRPKITGMVLTPVSSLPKEFDGLYLRGRTGLSAAISATSVYSTVAEYAVEAGSQRATGNPAVIDLVISEGNVRVTGTVTDARGFQSSVSASIQVLPYRNPKVTPHTGYNDVVCERARDTGELSADGTYLAIKAGKSFSSVQLQGVEKNSCELRYRWKPNGAADFSDWITLLAHGSRENEISLLVGNVVASLQKSYVVEVEAADSLGGSHRLTFQIMTEAVSFVLYDGPDGAGFGKYPEAAHVVDIASHMTLMVRGKMLVLGDIWNTLGLAAGVSESAYEYGRKEPGCHYLVTEGRHVHIAFNCAFAYSGTAVIINSEPIPEEHRPLRTVMSPCICNDRAIACVSVGPDGYIRAEWIQKPEDTVLTGAGDVTWVDGYLCYWT